VLASRIVDVSLREPGRVVGVPEGLTDAQIITRLERLERNVQALAERLGVSLEDPAAGVDTDIVQLARSGDRIGAAKLYAERTGSDFVQAQRVIADL
jgi:hypothetical protein